MTFSIFRRNYNFPDSSLSRVDLSQLAVSLMLASKFDEVPIFGARQSPIGQLVERVFVEPTPAQNQGRNDLAVPIQVKKCLKNI